VTTVALVGPDGAGKSTVVKQVAAKLPLPVRVVYMGVNLEASTVMLPTTRLALAAKRRRGGRPDLVGASLAPSSTDRSGARHGLKSGLRLAGWVAEEWFRQLIAWSYELRGFVVLFDRHFFCDYYAHDVAGRGPGRPLTSRIHGFLLERVYPRPDLVICLDAPAGVLLARKREGTLDSLERRRAEYLGQAGLFRGFAVVDASRPPDQVVDEVVALVRRFAGARTEPAKGLDPASPAVDRREGMASEGSGV
jgi:thymidylate kinase